MIEKRTEPRYRLDDDDQVTMASPEVSPRPSQVMDISFHGCRIRFGGDVAPGTPVKIRLDFLAMEDPKQAPVVNGQVMHRFPEPGGTTWQVGVKLSFSDPNEEKFFRLALLTQPRTEA